MYHIIIKEEEIFQYIFYKLDHHVVGGGKLSGLNPRLSCTRSIHCRSLKLISHAYENNTRNIKKDKFGKLVRYKKKISLQDFVRFFSYNYFISRRILNYRINVKGNICNQT